MFSSFFFFFFYAQFFTLLQTKPWACRWKVTRAQDVPSEAGARECLLAGALGELLFPAHCSCAHRLCCVMDDVLPQPGCSQPHCCSCICLWVNWLYLYRKVFFKACFISNGTEWLKAHSPVMLFGLWQEDPTDRSEEPSCCHQAFQWLAQQFRLLAASVCEDLPPSLIWERTSVKYERTL